MFPRLRRLLWLLPTLLTTTILAFAALSALAAQGQSEKRLPLFFNERPEGVAEFARQAVRTLGAERSDDAARAEAQAQLRRLGAAAFPFLPPELDTLPTSGRFRVATALRPVALRMGVAKESELASADEALAFWHRYWLDRALDFRRTAVRRAVKRLSRSPSELRAREVRQFDTFALGELVAELEQADTRSEPDRVRRIGGMLSHVTELGWTLPPDASLEATNGYVSEWQHWWDKNRRYYEAYAGPRRIAAMFTQTEYFHWLSGVWQSFGTGLMADQMSQRFLRSARGSLLLLLASCFGGYVGIVATRYLQLLRRASPGSTRRRGVPSTWWKALVLPIPFALVLFVVQSIASWTVAALLLTFAAAIRWSGASVFQSLPELGSYLGESPERIARQRAVRTVYFTQQFANDLPILFSHICLAEYFLGLNGLGTETVKAALSYDTAWLMVMVLLTTALAGVCRVLGSGSGTAAGAEAR